MSGGARNRFDGQQWREELIRKRTKEALAVWPQALCDQRAAACSYHESYAAQYHQERHHQIHRSERGLAHKV